MVCFSYANTSLFLNFKIYWYRLSRVLWVRKEFEDDDVLEFYELFLMDKKQSLYYNVFFAPDNCHLLGRDQTR